MAGPALCALERATIEAAHHVFETLSKRGNELFFAHCLRYAEEHPQALASATA